MSRSTTPLSLGFGDKGCASFVASLLICRPPHADQDHEPLHMQSRWILHPTLLYEYEQLVSIKSRCGACSRQAVQRDAAATGQHKRHSDCIASQWPTHTYMRLVSFTFRNTAGLECRSGRLSVVAKAWILSYKTNSSAQTKPPKIPRHLFLAW